MTAAGSRSSFPNNCLQILLECGERLKRVDASMPFWDDAVLSFLPGLSERLMLVDVFERPIGSASIRSGRIFARSTERM